MYVSVPALFLSFRLSSSLPGRPSVGELSPNEFQLESKVTNLSFMWFNFLLFLPNFLSFMTKSHLQPKATHIKLSTVAYTFK